MSIIIIVIIGKRGKRVDREGETHPTNDSWTTHGLWYTLPFVVKTEELRK